MKLSIYLLACLILISGDISAEQKSDKNATEKPVIHKQEGSKKENKISGQIFIATKGGENIKLALVTVFAIPENKMQSYINEKKSNAIVQKNKLISTIDLPRKELEQAKLATKEAKNYVDSQTGSSSFMKAMDVYSLCQKQEFEKLMVVSKIERDINYFNSIEYYFDSLPSEITKAKTDSDGKFNLSLPPGKYAITASSHRQAGGVAEYYYWLISVNTKSKNQSIMLSNDNLHETYCDDCIITKELMTKTY
jgi:hypothetical protein